MNNRNIINTTQHSTEEKSLLDSFTRKTFQTLVTASAVGAAVYPMEISKYGKQTGMSISFFSLLASNYKLLMQGFLNAQKASLAKNTAITQSGTVHASFVETMSASKEMSPNKDLSEFRVKTTTALPLSVKVPASIATAFTIGLLDTLGTNYYSNLKLINSIGKKVALPTFCDKFTFFRQGFVPRISKNFSNAFLFCGSEMFLMQPMTALLPPEKYGNANSILTTVLAGSLAGVATNGWEVIYSNMIKNMDFKTLQTPSMRATLKQLYKEKGAGVFFSGAIRSAQITTIAYAVIKMVDRVFSKNSNKEKISSSMFSLFDNRQEGKYALDDRRSQRMAIFGT